MRFKILHSMIAGGLLAACAHVTETARGLQLPRTAPVAAPARLVQMDYGRDAKFALCSGSECPAVTPKSMPSPSPDVRPTAIEVTPPAPPPAQPKPPPPQTKRQSMSVAFPFGGAVLSEREQAALSAALPIAKRATQIVIKGRTDNVGPEGANQHLALQRAVAVRNFLRQRLGDSDNVIVIEAQGLCCYVANNESSGGRARNRRVEVEFAIEG